MMNDDRTLLERAAKERPILFSAPMIRALLAGTKTQTRRAVNGMALEWLRPEGFTPAYVAMPENHLCPYGFAGDRLWVRECFSGPHHQDRHPPRDWHSTDPIHYWADGNPDAGDWTRPRPGMFMPRWASRITLEITGVRVERLQDISEADARAEGVEQWRAGWDTKTAATMFLQGTRARVACGDDSGTAKRLYMLLWEQINGPVSWDANPWVWVVEFKRAAALAG